MSSRKRVSAAVFMGAVVISVLSLSQAFAGGGWFGSISGNQDQSVESVETSQRLSPTIFVLKEKELSGVVGRLAASFNVIKKGGEIIPVVELLDGNNRIHSRYMIPAPKNQEPARGMLTQVEEGNFSDGIAYEGKSPLSGKIYTISSCMKRDRIRGWHEGECSVGIEQKDLGEGRAVVSVGVTLPLIDE